MCIEGMKKIIEWSHITTGASELITEVLWTEGKTSNRIKLRETPKAIRYQRCYESNAGLRNNSDKVKIL
jgi:hypothetical protein